MSIGVCRRCGDPVLWPRGAGPERTVGAKLSEWRCPCGGRLRRKRKDETLRAKAPHVSERRQLRFHFADRAAQSKLFE